MEAVSRRVGIPFTAVVSGLLPATLVGAGLFWFRDVTSTNYGRHAVLKAFDAIVALMLGAALLRQYSLSGRRYRWYAAATALLVSGALTAVQLVLTTTGAVRTSLEQGALVLGGFLAATSLLPARLRSSRRSLAVLPLAGAAVAALVAALAPPAVTSAAGALGYVLAGLAFLAEDGVDNLFVANLLLLSGTTGLLLERSPLGGFLWWAGNYVELAANVAALGFLLVLHERLFHAVEANRARLAAMTAELERSNRDLQELATVASHDMREPLRMISSYLTLLRRREALSAEGKEFVDFAVDGAERMKRLIESLLAYARVDAKAPAAAEVDARALVEQVRASLRVLIAEKNARITVGELPVVQGDPVQLAQLFQNLIGNALKYHRPGVPPALWIDARPSEGDGWELVVRDEGIGVPPEASERIFKMFQRLHSREEFPGVGIGLSVCRRIVERHGGRIWVTAPPDGGAAFHFTLPAPTH